MLPDRTGKDKVDPNLPVMEEGVHFFPTPTMNPLKESMQPLEKKLGGFSKLDLLKDVRGPYKFQDGSTYLGQMNGNNMRDGLGKLIKSDGSFVYEGEFVNDKITGKGRIIWPDWSFYIGEVKEMALNGNGQMTRKDGYFYTGGWKDNRPEGYGQERFPGDTTFRGYFANGLRNGKGDLMSPDGSVITAVYLDGNIQGDASMTFKDKRSFNGKFYNGSPIDGTMNYPDGSIYAGQMANLKKHGKGKFTRKDGYSYDGLWANDLQEGMGVEVSDKGVTNTGKFAAGRYVGPK